MKGELIENRILKIRGRRVILDADLALLYGVPTKVLNQAVKRNAKRFPDDFAFRLTSAEKVEVVTICDHLRKLRFSPVLPMAFSEHGALMAANVLNSPRAVEMSLFVVRVFVRMRERMFSRESLGKKLAEIEKTLLIQDVALRDIYEKISPLLLPPPLPPKRRIGFRVDEPRLMFESNPVLRQIRARIRGLRLKKKTVKQAVEFARRRG